MKHTVPSESASKAPKPSEAGLPPAELQHLDTDDFATLSKLLDKWAPQCDGSAYAIATNMVLKPEFKDTPLAKALAAAPLDFNKDGQVTSHEQAAALLASRNLHVDPSNMNDAQQHELLDKACEIYNENLGGLHACHLPPAAKTPPARGKS